MKRAALQREGDAVDRRDVAEMFADVVKANVDAVFGHSAAARPEEKFRPPSFLSLVAAGRQYAGLVRACQSAY